MYTGQLPYATLQSGLKQRASSQAGRRLALPVCVTAGRGPVYSSCAGNDARWAIGSESVSVVIIGGGVVGCALACELAQKFQDVFLLEQMPKLGMGASSRNSGVIHAGLYYTPGSHKARHCVAGNRLTYEFCAAHGVPHRRTGKLVVASSTGEVPRLEALAKRAAENGV